MKTANPDLPARAAYEDLLRKKLLMNLKPIALASLAGGATIGSLTGLKKMWGANRQARTFEKERDKFKEFHVIKNANTQVALPKFDTLTAATNSHWYGMPALTAAAAIPANGGYRLTKFLVDRLQKANQQRDVEESRDLFERSIKDLQSQPKQASDNQDDADLCVWLKAADDAYEAVKKVSDTSGLSFQELQRVEGTVKQASLGGTLGNAIVGTAKGTAETIFNTVPKSVIGLAAMVPLIAGAAGVHSGYNSTKYEAGPKSLEEKEKQRIREYLSRVHSNRPILADVAEES